MKIFIFENVEHVSDRYHEEGGLVVIAKDRTHANELIDADPSVEVTAEEWADALTYALAGEPKPKVFTFPDAGCC